MRLPEYIYCGHFDSRDNVKYHEHPGAELIYIAAGRCRIEVEGNVFSGSEGTLFVIPAGVLHNQINFGRVETRYVVFRSSGLFHECARVVNLTHDTWIVRWLNEIFELQKEAHENIAELGSGLLFLILQRISELEESRTKHRDYPPSLVRALVFIERNFTMQISLGDIAAHSGICREYLCAMFKKHLDTSPVSYLLELRLKYALSLLDDRYLSIKDISSRCGFGDSNYFCRRFRKHFGCTPGEMREDCCPFCDNGAE